MFIVITIKLFTLMVLYSGLMNPASVIDTGPGS